MSKYSTLMNTRIRHRLHSVGLAVVEFTLVLPVLMVIMFGVVDFGRAVLVKQVMINLSREAANLASRGTPFPDVVAAIQLSSSPLNLQTSGFLILTEVTRDINGNITINQQTSAGGNAGNSRIGSGSGNPANLPPTDLDLPLPGQSMYVAEVFYNSPPITPLGELVNISPGEDYYDSAFF